MRQRVLIGLTSFLCLGAFSWPATSQVFRDDRYGVTLESPAGWLLWQNPPSSGLHVTVASMLSPADADGRQAWIEFGIARTAAEVSPASIIDELLAERASRTDYRLLTRSETLLGPLPGAEATYAYRDSSRVLVATRVAVAHHDHRLYALTLTTPRIRLDTHTQAFDRVRTSLAIDGVTPPPPGWKPEKPNPRVSRRRPGIVRFQARGIVLWYPRAWSAEVTTRRSHANDDQGHLGTFSPLANPNVTVVVTKETMGKQNLQHFLNRSISEIRRETEARGFHVDILARERTFPFGRERMTATLEYRAPNGTLHHKIVLLAADEMVIGISYVAPKEMFATYLPQAEAIVESVVIPQRTGEE